MIDFNDGSNNKNSDYDRDFDKLDEKFQSESPSNSDSSNEHKTEIKVEDSDYKPTKSTTFISPKAYQSSRDRDCTARVSECLRIQHQQYQNDNWGQVITISEKTMVEFRFSVFYNANKVVTISETFVTFFIAQLMAFAEC